MTGALPHACSSGSEPTKPTDGAHGVHALTRRDSITHDPIVPSHPSPVCATQPTRAARFLAPAVLREATAGGQAEMTQGGTL